MLKAVRKYKCFFLSVESIDAVPDAFQILSHVLLSCQQDFLCTFNLLNIHQSYKPYNTLISTYARVPGIIFLAKTMLHWIFTLILTISDIPC